MEQRRIFECWNCKRNYSLLHEISGQLQLDTKCPYCYKEGKVILDHYLMESSAEVLRSAPPYLVTETVE
jgi:hypothetical protein